MTAPDNRESLDESPDNLVGTWTPCISASRFQAAREAKHCLAEAPGHNDMKTSRMPSLNAIRAFEAVGRCLSYRRAAQELCVTPSALSHQIRALQEYFGVPLLKTVGRRLVLTPLGEKYLRQISQGLAKLSLATSDLLQKRADNVLRITVPPSFASWWLLPRIGKFFADYPNISLDFSAGGHSDHCDVSIRYMTHAPAGSHATPIASNESFPVCSPRLMEGPEPLRAVGDLPKHTLLCTGENGTAVESAACWSGWLDTIDQLDTARARRLYLSPTGMTLQAAAQGLGVALARTLLAADAVASGLLVCPFGPALPLCANYYFVSSDGRSGNRAAAAFRDWLLTEAEMSVAAVKIPPTQ